MEFLAKDYKNRQDLELAVKSEVGTDIKANKEAGHLIKGTREELKILFLSDTNSVFGVKVEITDSPTHQLVKDKTKKDK